MGPPAVHVQQIEWCSRSGREKLTAIRQPDGTWRLHYQGSATFEAAYYRLLAQIIPAIDPEVCIRARAVRRSQAISKKSKTRQQRVDAWLEIMASAPGRNEALKRLPDPVLREILGDIPVEAFAAGLQALRQQMSAAA